MPDSRFIPPWLEATPSKASYRSIFKWGDPNIFKHPNRHFYEYLKSALGMTDVDFMKPKNIGEQAVKVHQTSKLNESEINALREIVGPENVIEDDYSRACHAYGKAMLDLMRLRDGRVENLPDVVVYPRNSNDVRHLVEYCTVQKIPVIAFGGGTSVTRGVECTHGGISLDMHVHMNRVLNINPENQSVTVEPGIDGPTLEKNLNHSEEIFGSPHAYTCGHFPQSFEYSTVGGWVLTRGAGQNSTYYGKIEDLVLSQKYVTPVGDFITMDVPAKATGPDADQIMIGSEGAFGILVEVTLKIFRHSPGTRRYFSFIFHTWDDAISACREVMQGEFGFPSVFRLSDPEETEIAFKMYGLEDTILDQFLQARNFLKNQRCLLLGHTEGDRDFSKLTWRKIKKVCRQFGALYTTGYVAKRWEHGRFTDPYLRDDLGDFGIVIDTLECGINWSHLRNVWLEVKNFCHSRSNTVCMAHSSHFYPQGTNLYFVFVTRIEDINDYINYQAGILDIFQKYGATMSHHHGIGKLIAPWLEGQIGKNVLDVFKALKQHFDPNHILNPGGTLGLDLQTEEERLP